MGNKINYGFNGANFELSYDGNEDGQSSVSLSLNLMEILDELKKDGKAEIEAKSVKLEMDGSKIIIKVDANKDGEEFLKLEADLAEGMDEAF